jgi:hypothetical protein
VFEERKLTFFEEQALICGQKCTRVNEGSAFWQQKVTGKEESCSNLLKARERGFR